MRGGATSGGGSLQACLECLRCYGSETCSGERQTRGRGVGAPLLASRLTLFLEARLL